MFSSSFVLLSQPRVADVILATGPPRFRSSIARYSKSATSFKEWQPSLRPWRLKNFYEEFKPASTLREMPAAKLAREMTNLNSTLQEIHLDLRHDLGNTGHGRRFAVRAVAYTLRHLVILGHFESALLLDHAFFSPENAPSPLPPKKDPLTRNVKWTFPSSLGLKRGNTQLAWMQILNVYSEGPFADHTTFFALMKQMMEELGDVELDPKMLVFLIQKSQRLKLVPPIRNANTKNVNLSRFIEGIAGQTSFLSNPFLFLALCEAQLAQCKSSIDTVSQAELLDIENKLNMLLPYSRNPTVDLDNFQRAHILFLGIRFIALRITYPSSFDNSLGFAQPLSDFEAALDLFRRMIPLVPENHENIPSHICSSAVTMIQQYQNIQATLTTEFPLSTLRTFCSLLYRLLAKLDPLPEDSPLTFHVSSKFFIQSLTSILEDQVSTPFEKFELILSLLHILQMTKKLFKNRTRELHIVRSILKRVDLTKLYEFILENWDLGSYSRPHVALHPFVGIQEMSTVADRMLLLVDIASQLEAEGPETTRELWLRPLTKVDTPHVYDAINIIRQQWREEIGTIDE